MHTLLRPARADLQDPILGGLMTAVIREAINVVHQDGTVRNVASNLEVWLRQPEACVHIVACSGDAIVSVVLVKGFWKLCSLFVSTAHPGEGIGCTLTTAALDACRGRSPIDAVYLNAAPAAVGFRGV